MNSGLRAARFAAIAILSLSGVLIAAGSAIGQGTLPNTVVAGGGGTVSAGPFTVHSTIGEPAAGTVSSGNLVLHSGFQATFVVSGADPGNCSIFCDGFED